MHRAHYMVFSVAAQIPLDSWRATVFLLHVPFYGQLIGAYDAFCAPLYDVFTIHHTIVISSICSSIRRFILHSPVLQGLLPSKRLKDCIAAG